MIVYKLSNFEANFTQFLKSLSISRTVFQRLKADFRELKRFLILTFPQDKLSMKQVEYLSTSLLSRFQEYYLKKTRNSSRVK